MSLVQSYRSQLAAKQKHRMLIYLMLAGAVHFVGAVGLLQYSEQQLKQEAKPDKSPIPLEFINIAPSAKSTAPPKTERRSTVNSIAAGQPNPNLSVQAGKVGANPIQQSAQVKKPTISQPPVASSLRPQPSQSVQPPQFTKPPQPLQPSQLLQPASRLESSRPAPQPSSPPSVRPTQPARVSAAQLGNSLSRSTGSSTNGSGTNGSGISGSGISGQLNSNRNGAGTGIDAVKDDRWGGYLAALNRVVDQNWQRVAVAATRRTKVRFEVNRQGYLTHLELVEPSGDDSADQAAIQAVQTAAPFAPLPQNTPEDILIVNFTFTQWLTPASP